MNILPEVDGSVTIDFAADRMKTSFAIHFGEALGRGDRREFAGLLETI